MLDMLGARLKGLRLKHALTQEALAEKSDVSRVTIARIESGSGKTYPTTDIIVKLANYFKVSPGYLLGDDDGGYSEDLIDPNDVSYALMSESQELSEEQKQEVLEFIKFKKRQKK